MLKMNTVLEGLRYFFEGVATILIGFSEFLIPNNSNSLPPSENSDSIKKSNRRLTSSDIEAFRKDRIALASDWKVIGRDLRNAINTYVETH